MDIAYLLILDAIALIITTIALTYFFFKDILKGKKKRERD
jgi:hypothetical protein